MEGNALVVLAGIVAIFAACIWVGQKLDNGIERAYFRRTKELAPTWVQAIGTAVNLAIALGLSYLLITL